MRNEKIELLQLPQRSTHVNGRRRRKGSETRIKIAKISLKGTSPHQQGTRKPRKRANRLNNLTFLHVKVEEVQ